jgi:hypothetical protein
MLPGARGRGEGYEPLMAAGASRLMIRSGLERSVLDGGGASKGGSVALPSYSWPLATPGAPASRAVAPQAARRRRRAPVGGRRGCTGEAPRGGGLGLPPAARS